MAKQSEMLVKPTLEEVLHQSKALGPPGLPVDEAQAFFYYYESNGWRVGKNPMKCWKSALAGWRVRWLQRQKQRLSEKISQNREARVDQTLKDIDEGLL